MQHHTIIAAQTYGLGLTETTIASKLKTHGYRTHMTGKVSYFQNVCFNKDPSGMKSLKLGSFVDKFAADQIKTTTVKLVDIYICIFISNLLPHYYFDTQ